MKTIIGYAAYALFAISLSLILCSCASPGGGSSSVARIDPNSPVVIPVAITEKSGRGFSCFAVSLPAVGKVFCAVTGSPDVRLGLTSAAFVNYAQAPDVFALETWDDSLCFSARVAQRPLSRTPGVALYCMGEASLSGAISGFSAVYSGPSFSSGANGSGDLTYLAEPYLGGEFSMDVLTNTGANYGVMTDGRGLSGESVLSCTVTDGILDCPGFTVDLN